MLDGIEQSIARSTDRQAVEILLDSEIRFCAENYCGATNLTDELLEDAVETVLEKYPFLGIKEIRAAFKAGASEAFEVNMIAYKGIFTITMLCNILSGYSLYRHRIKEEIMRHNDQQEENQRIEKQREFEQSEEGKRYYAEKLIEFLIRKTELAGSTHYDQLTEAGLLVLTNDQKRTYFEQAKATLKAKLEKELIEGDYFRQAYLRQLASNVESADYQQKLIAEAKTLAVVEFIEQIKIVKAIFETP